MIEKEYDLHDQNIKTQAELHYILDQILIESVGEGHSPIRIITGRGNNSSHKPLLKPETFRYCGKHKLVKSIRLEETMGSFEISLVN